MRRILIATALFLLAAPTFAGQRFADRVERGERVPGAPWIAAARFNPVDLSTTIAAAALAELPGPRPIALIETNYYTFLPTERLQLRMTVNANGYTAPTTMYLYWENRTTGERRYYSIPSNGLATAGTVVDMFGSAGSPVPVIVPALNDFVLFGTSTDAASLSWGLNGAIGGSIATPAGQTGLYQYVLEIRDAAGKRILAKSNAMYSYIEGSETISGTITASATWTANKRYLLNEYVAVTSPAVLTIEPGTVIYGNSSRATLFIQKGAKIMADGTARRPIIFTSAQRVGSRAQRDWGSLVILGLAPVNNAGGTVRLEGLPDEPQYYFGGTNPADNSGIVRYVRLEFGGFEIQTNQEINGLTLGGVGTGTVIDYVEVLQNKDDAFEFFGGTVNAKHLLGIGFADDGLDFDFGYIGNIQYAALIKRAGNDENDGNIVIESDNNTPQFDLLPRTNPLVYNVTGIREPGTFGNHGAVLRRGTGGRFYNFIVQDSRQSPITLRDDSTFNANALVLDNSILFGDFSDAKMATTADRPASTRTFAFTTMKNNRNVDPLLAIGTPTLLETLMPDLTPTAASPALDASFVAHPPDNGFFDQVDFQGGIEPGNNWMLTGWANFSDN